MPRHVIDDWPVKEAGLPPRIVNACGRQGIETVGALRAVPDAKLIQMRSLGNRSLTEVRDFFAFCRRLERGRLRFESAPALLQNFLNETSLAMLMERYALRARDGSSASGATLDTIGQQFGLTRERVRQQIAAIHDDLQTRLAQACFAPLITWYAEFMRTRDGIADPDDLQAVPFRPWLKGINPYRFLQLLTEHQSTIVLHGGLFSVLPPKILEDIEKIAVRFLHRYPKPQRLSDVIAEFEEQGWFRQWPEFQPRLVMKTIENSPLIGATREDDYFLFPEGAIYVLATLISEFPRPVGHKVLIQRFNEEVKPVSQRDETYLTDLLSRSSIFVRGRDRTYRLRK